VVNKITFSEYKRRQAAPGLKVSPRAFGMGRRIPVAQRFRTMLIPDSVLPKKIHPAEQLREKE
jgi:hypothetical protein